MKNNGFTLEEAQLLIEALLFTANTDICSDHTLAQRAKMLNFAQNLNEKFDKPHLHNIFVFKDNTVFDETTNSVIEKFPNVPLQDIIKD